MDTLRSQNKGLNTDDLDDLRVNQLIARYSGIHHISEEADDGFGSTYVAARRRIRSSDNEYDGSERKNIGDHNIGIFCDNQSYDSTNSSDSSSAKLSSKSPNEEDFRSKNRVLLQDHNHNKSVDQPTCVAYTDPTLKSFAEKTTYCRPIKSDDNKLLIRNLIEKNAKLQLLLTKLVITRKKEKEREKWNNHVNSFNIQNRIYRDISTHCSLPSRSCQSGKPLLINVMCDNKLNHCDSFRKILHSAKNELPLPHEYSNENIDNRYVDDDDSTLKHRFNSQLNCFPSTSQIRKTSRKGPCNYIIWPSGRTLNGSSIIIPENNGLVNKATKMDKGIDVDLSPPISIRSSKDQFVNDIDVQKNKYAQTHITFDIRWPSAFHGRSNIMIPENEDSCVVNKAAKIDKGIDRDLHTPISARSSMVCLHQFADEIDVKQSKDAQTHITFGGCNSFATYVQNGEQQELKTTIRENNVVVKGKDKLDVASGIEKQESVCWYELHEKKESTMSISKQNMTVEDLDRKLDVLIGLFKSFLADLNAKHTLNKVSNDCEVMCDIDENQISDKQQQQIGALKSTNNKRKKNVFGNAMTNTSLCAIETRFTPTPFLLNTRLNTILYEELDKSNKLRSEIEAMLSPSASPPRPDQSNDNIPTRERSTEVTASLSKTKLDEPQNNGVTINHVRSALDCQISQARAMNTEDIRDPLGLLTLLSFSTEAIKQLLSLVPNMNSWYLRTFRPEPATEYVCNICGAAFRQPSQLSAHILGHDLGRARDCCVCQHVVDSIRPSQLFRCRYCGQRFTRAYCCELHEQGCARRFGRIHDTNPSLAVLR